jgi:ABC-type dipeptide/oligopeptide/nickel transport system permease component
LRIIRFVVKRLLVAAPQVVAVTIITFLLVRLLPGNPAYQLAGPFATAQTREAMTRRLGLDLPLWQQYLRYVDGLVHGDWGQSWFTARPVAQEMLARLPATLELITIAMVVIVGGGIGIGVLVSRRSGGWLDRITTLYGQLAGAFPDFWLGLVLSYVFFFLLGWLPGPSGRLPMLASAPPKVTGFYTIDSLLAGDVRLFLAAAAQLVLPVATLVIVYMSGIAKLARSTIREMLRSDMAQYARLCGLPETTVLRYALKNSLPPILTLIGLTYGFLLGGAVLVETVFSWGGIGQYVVASIGRSDYFPVQAFVLAAALINIAVYLIVDIAHVMIDPRIDY